MTPLAVTTEYLGIALSLASLWLAGRKSIWSPVTGLAATVPWVLFSWEVGAYPVIGFNLVMGALSLRQLLLWMRN